MGVRTPPLYFRSCITIFILKNLSMHAHIFQHVPFEGPGTISTWLGQKQATITSTRFFEGEIPPPLKGVDLLIIMGGPMSVNDTLQFPWLRMEKESIRRVVDADIPVLGICLGAQLIASALGAIIRQSPIKEIGWFPISGKSCDGCFLFPETLSVFHWHGETFDLPPDAQLLASTAECTNQAFQLADKKVVGIQFHLETTPESLDSIIENCRDDLAEGPKVMFEAEIKEQASSHYTSIHQEMTRLLDFLVS